MKVKKKDQIKNYELTENHEIFRHMFKESAQKKSDLFLNKGPRNSHLPLNLMDIRTDICNYRVALLLIVIIHTI